MTQSNDDLRSKSKLSKDGGGQAEMTWRLALRIVRAPLGILLLAGFVLTVPPQVRDMLAALDEGGVCHGVIQFHFAFGFLALSAWGWSRAQLAGYFNVPDTDNGRAAFAQAYGAQSVWIFTWLPRSLFLLAVAFATVMIILNAQWQSLLWLTLWAVPGAILVFHRIAILTRFGLIANRAEEAKNLTLASFHDWVGTIAARFNLLVARAPVPRWMVWLLITVSLGVFVFGAVESFWPWNNDDGTHHEGFPVWMAQIFPGPAAALIAVSLMIAPLSVLTFLSDGIRMPARVHDWVLGIKRLPVLSFLIVWIAVMPTICAIHTVRIAEISKNEPLVTERQDLGNFFKGWVAKCAKGSESDPVYPVIVAVSGGASRAAMWGQSVLRQVEIASSSSPKAPKIFAVTSVSGGSLGVGAYMAMLAKDSNSDCRLGVAGIADRLNDTALAADAIGPVLIGALVVDIPRAILAPLASVSRWATGFEARGGDRAEALERAFETLWRNRESRLPATEFDSPFLSLFYDKGEPRPGMPIWIANGTDVNTGGRLLTVPFSPDEKQWPFRAAVDLLSFLSADVPISTAINNTARFPYIEPSGELAKVGGQACRKAEELIDGGYFENEGLQTALELAAWLTEHGPDQAQHRPVWPIIVQATADGTAKLPGEEFDPKDPDGARVVVRCPGWEEHPIGDALYGRSSQLVAPLEGLYNVRSGHSDVLLHEARDRYCGLKPRFFHFWLPGFSKSEDAPPREDVPLNWMLSQGKARFVLDSITWRQRGNAQELKQLFAAFNPSEDHGANGAGK
jgi:hypothetical protein